MQLTVREQHREMWPNSVTWCVPKQSSHHRKASHGFEGWNRFRAPYRFYLLGSTYWSFLWFWNALDHLHIFSFKTEHVLSSVASEINLLLCVVKMKNQKCTFRFLFAYVSDSTDEWSANPESHPWLILKYQASWKCQCSLVYSSVTGWFKQPSCLYMKDHIFDNNKTPTLGFFKMR